MGPINDNQADGAEGGLLPAQREQLRRGDRRRIDVMAIKWLNRERALKRLDALELVGTIRPEEQMETAGRHSSPIFNRPLDNAPR